MDTMQAFAMGQANRGKGLKVFDWNKAAKLIKDKGAQEASAGLCGDWEYTGGSIFSEGKPDMESYTFLASTWATPELEIDGETVDCFVSNEEQPNWGSDTKWPESALAILNG